MSGVNLHLPDLLLKSLWKILNNQNFPKLQLEMLLKI